MMYRSTGMRTFNTAMSTGPRYKVFCIVGERDISKYTDSEIEARKILKELKEAAATLGLLDIFRGEIYEIN